MVRLKAGTEERPQKEKLEGLFHMRFLDTGAFGYEDPKVQRKLSSHTVRE